jgi:hypothetical protein
MRLIELNGRRFGSLVVLSRAPQVMPRRGAWWLCRCDCGREHSVSSTHLVSGRVSSCGCQRSARIAISKRKQPGESGFNKVFQGYKENAKNRGIIWLLTRDEFRELCCANCYYCCEPPSNWSYGSGKTSYASPESREYSGFVYNGVDRKDPALGYKVENCVPCCASCNTRKAGFTEEEFWSWIQKMATILASRHQQ